jgi:hypothetical protein
MPAASRGRKLYLRYRFLWNMNEYSFRLKFQIFSRADSSTTHNCLLFALHSPFFRGGSSLLLASTSSNVNRNVEEWSGDEAFLNPLVLLLHFPFDAKRTRNMTGVWEYLFRFENLPPIPRMLVSHGTPFFRYYLPFDFQYRVELLCWLQRD